MFGDNTDSVQNNGAVVNDYNSDLPVGGEDLLSSGTNPTSTPAPQPVQSAYTEPNAPYTPPSSIVDPVAPSLPTDTNVSTNSVSDGIATDDLVGIKQNALEELKPLVSHLDQTPEEKFRTTMMMIQASDDKSLLKDAYSQAQAISDEKVRAQALLDVVNEINYFTQIDNRE